MSTGSEQESQNVAAQSTVVAGMTLLSRLSGFARDIVLSYFFGASGIADAFFVAFRIPNFFRRLFAEGAFNQAFVPVLTRYRDGARDELLEFSRVMSGNLAAALLVFVLLGILAAPGLVAIFAPGFWTDPARFDLTTDMLRITFPYLGFISMTAFAGALLNSHHRYAVPAFTPVLLNVSLICAVFLAAGYFSQPVFALAWGVLFAGVAQLLFQLPSLARLGLIVRPTISFKHAGAKKVGILLVPAVFAASASQVNALIGTILASTLQTGSISWLYYSDRLLELPIGLVAVALGTVLLPNLSRLDSAGDTVGFSGTLDWGVRVGIFFGVPASAALYVLALPLVSSIFMHGALTDIDARMTALSLQAFAVGLLPLVGVKVLAPAYFARQDTKTPFQFAVVAVVVNVVLSLALFRFMGHVGLALATACAAWVNALLLWRGLVSTGRYRPTPATGYALLRVALATAVMVAGLGFLTPDSAQWLTASVAVRAVWLTTAVTGGAAVYAVVLLLSGTRPGHLLHRT